VFAGVGCKKVHQNTAVWCEDSNKGREKVSLSAGKTFVQKTAAVIKAMVGYLFQEDKGKKVKVSICIAHLAYNASNALFVTNPSRQPHGHHVQPADTG